MRVAAFVIAASVASAVACRDSSGPEAPTLDGTYTMVSVDGSELPAEVKSTMLGAWYVTEGSLEFHTRGRVTDTRTVAGNVTTTIAAYRLLDGDTIIVDRVNGPITWSDTGSVAEGLLTLNVKTLIPGAYPDLLIAYVKEPGS